MIPFYLLEYQRRTYRILDELFKATEDFEGYISTYTDDGNDMGYFNLLRRADFHFTITEEKAKRRASQENKLILTFYPKSMIYNKKYEAMIYEDEKDNPIENQLQKIMYQMIIVAEQIYAREIVKIKKMNVRNRNGSV